MLTARGEEAATPHAVVNNDQAHLQYRPYPAARGKQNDFVLTVKTNVTTLCPCSKAISAYGAHNQRGEVTVQIRSRTVVWIEDLIGIIESSASSELYALLKRQDEKAVTERAYENPVFVEDLVRNIALKLNAHREVTWYKVEAENQESIHNHNAYACIEKPAEPGPGEG